MKTIEKPIFKSVPTKETRTLYVAEDDTEWGDEKQANARNKLLTCKELIKDWPTAAVMEDEMYLVKDETEYIELRELCTITRYVRCNQKPKDNAYPCVVRFDYGGDYPETLIVLTRDDVRRLNTLLEEN